MFNASLKSHTLKLWLKIIEMCIRYFVTKHYIFRNAVLNFSLSSSVIFIFLKKNVKINRNFCIFCRVLFFFHEHEYYPHFNLFIIRTLSTQCDSTMRCDRWNVNPVTDVVLKSLKCFVFHCLLTNEKISE